jgi:predicted nucleic acid-binding protein
MTESIAGSSVSTRETVDTNVLIDAVDPSSGPKHRIALDLIQRLIDRDALIRAAAKENGIPLVDTEDFHHGRDLEGVRIINQSLGSPSGPSA